MCGDVCRCCSLDHAARVRVMLGARLSTATAAGGAVWRVSGAARGRCSNAATLLAAASEALLAFVATCPLLPVGVSCVVLACSAGGAGHGSGGWPGRDSLSLLDDDAAARCGQLSRMPHKATRGAHRSGRPLSARASSARRAPPPPGVRARAAARPPRTARPREHLQHQLVGREQRQDACIGTRLRTAAPCSIDGAAYQARWRAIGAHKHHGGERSDTPDRC
jgi:hypothetical protein